MDERVMTVDEILKAHRHWSYVRTDRNGTRYFMDHVCGRCGGTGRVPFLVDNGVCYGCGGAGLLMDGKIVKIYTPEHEEKLAKQREARAAKVLAAKVADFNAHLDEKYAEKGFGKEGDEYAAYRVVGNTYSIKDTLKELGCRYDPAMGWYSPKALDDYHCQRITASQSLVEDKEHATLTWRPIDEIKALWEENQPQESKSMWQGEIGQRIEIAVKVTKAVPVDGFRGGQNYIYLMEDADGNVYKWVTAKYLEPQSEHTFRTTIKDYTEYKGVKQTIVTRAMEVQNA